MIEFDRVSKRYPDGTDALVDVSLRLERGELAFLTGHSGAGKSTLLRLLLRLELPSRGALRVAGLDLARMKARAIPRYRQQIGAVFQDPHLLEDRSVFDNVALPLIIAGYRSADRAARARAALTRVGLAERAEVRPERLSTGERQRVGIARAVVARPAVLLADEPTGNLDPGLSEEIMALFRLFQSIGTTVLIASHDIDLIERFDARVLTLDAGRLVRGGLGE
ncbi:MAG: cell division ATP-binding protein FtsE [Pseudomonadales bacterium]|nr:cell division ATP-binding protein FtsE [Pseudomonadales bacterium]